LIGRELIRQLAASGKDVVASDLRSPALDAAPLREIRFVPANVAVQGEMVDLVRKYQPERIFHLAAMSGQAAEQRHALAFEINVRGTYNVLEAARMASTPRVLHVSSTDVYGRDPAPVIDDYSLERPDTHDGCAKHFAENLGRWYVDKFKLDFRAVRLPVVVGPRVAGPGGANAQSPNWVAPMIEDALAGRAHPCEAAQNSTSLLMSVGDAARAAIALAEAPPEQMRTRCYTAIGIPQATTVEEMGRFLEKRFPGFAVKYGPEAKPAVCPTLDDRFARDEWNWEARHRTVDALVADFVERLASGVDP